MEDPTTDQLDITQWEAARYNGDGTAEVPDEDEGSRTVERPPRVPRTTSEKVKAFWRERQERQAEKPSKTPAKRTSGRASKPVYPRVGTERLIEWGWTMLARMASPVSVPVARTLAMQAPVAGEILEDVVKETVVDRLLQPLARMTEGSEAVVALLGPPVLVGLMHKNPNLRAPLSPLLRSALMTWVRVAGPRLEEKAAEEKEFEDKYGTTVDMLMAGIFEGIDDEQSGQQTQTPGPVPPPPPPAPVPVPDFPPAMAHPMAAPMRPTQRGTKVPPVKRLPKKATVEK